MLLLALVACADPSTAPTAPTITTAVAHGQTVSFTVSSFVLNIHHQPAPHMGMAAPSGYMSGAYGTPWLWSRAWAYPAHGYRFCYWLANGKRLTVPGTKLDRPNPLVVSGDDVALWRGASKLTIEAVLARNLGKPGPC